jgi:hypothetical protein
MPDGFDAGRAQAQRNRWCSEELSAFRDPRRQSPPIRNENSLDNNPREYIIRFRNGGLLQFVNKIDIIKEEISNCVRNICARCDLTLSDEKRTTLEKHFVGTIAEATLPAEAPQLYDPHREGRGGIVKFLERVWYDPWIAAGVFTRSYFRHRDPRGAVALENYIRQPGHELPFDVPTKSQELDRKLGDPEQSRSAWRIAKAAERRRAKDRADGGTGR